MSENPSGRPGFRDWIDDQPQNDWPTLPLTHVTKGLNAEDIIRSGSIGTEDCPVFKKALAYLFYGRPSYRVTGDGAIKLAAACPFCFIFTPEIITQASSIHAFDTGAFDARMYKHALLDEMKIADFSLEIDNNRPNKLIETVFGSLDAYFDGTIDDKLADGKARQWEFLAQSYLSLLMSTGRNEPDDRIGSIEATFSKPLELEGNLLALIVPHIVWDDKGRAPWLSRISERGVNIIPYHFVPGRHPDYYYALLEAEVRRLYKERGWLA